MTNKAISSLAGASVPLGGTELIPIVQSGTTLNTTIENLTAGRAVSVSALIAGGVPPLSGIINVVSAAGDVALAISDNTTSSIYVRPASGGVIIGTDGGGTLRLAAGGSAAANTSIVLEASGNAIVNSGNLIQGTAAKGINFTANTPAAGMTSQLLNWHEEGTWTPNQGAGLTVVGAFSSSGTYTRIGRQVTVRGQVVGATSVAVVAAGVMSSNLPFAASVSHAGSMFNSAVTTSGVVQITASSVVAATTIAATPNITFTATYTV